ncbi:hypothetical protein FOTG_18942 [Fusarium oxysporum f. sp. vasinfectum 25433]|uniref:Uncharacterized protein n=1 Tax=Fusarium oxysporum f. sp. vasinfectum 25433 TaxID=1089449 RepID=X0KG34_FUSOX|nr:hypothetical protein FOTG_18942 [Fusarium oxysporum f. sp. vasinfectum 25433]
MITTKMIFLYHGDPTPANIQRRVERPVASLLSQQVQALNQTPKTSGTSSPS